MTRLEGPYHQWQINAYLSCPHALLLRLQGVSPAFRTLGQCRGTVVHNAIQRLHQDEAWDDWDRVFDDAWFAVFSDDGPSIDAPPEKIDQEYDDWHTAVRNYVQRERDAEVLFTELPVRGRVTSRSGREYTLEGRVDQIRRSPDGGFEVVELKTSKSLPGSASLERNVQMCLYCWCCLTGEVCVDDGWRPAKEVLPGLLTNYAFYKLSDLIPYKRSGRRRDGTKYAPGDLRGEVRLAMPVHADQLVEGTQAIARIIAAMRAGGFFWNPSALYGGCDACPYKYACGSAFSSNDAGAAGQAPLAACA